MSINRNIFSDTSRSESELTNDFTWRGLSQSGKAHPLTGDIVYVDDLEDIKQSIRNIVLTTPDERPFSSSDISTRVNALLFELITTGIDIELKEELTRKLVRYEPRAYYQDIKLTAYPTKHAVDIAITFKQKSTNKVATVSVFLERV